LKNSLYLLPFLICACETPAEPVATPADTVAVVPTEAPPAFVDAVEVPAYALLDTTVSFAGTWVNEIYVNKILQFKTPCRAQNVMRSCITVPDSTLKITRMVDGFYEGSADQAFGFDNGRYVMYYTEPELMKEPVSEVEIISPDKIRIDTSYFIKISSGHILEEILFAGKYKTEQGTDVVFTAEGRISGLDGIKEYTAEIDYTGLETDKPINLLYMGVDKVALDRYCYRFSGDILFIYKTECLDIKKRENFCAEPAQAELVYTLIKQSN
jgi:hypothetical protein